MQVVLHFAISFFRHRELHEEFLAGHYIQFFWLRCLN